MSSDCVSAPLIYLFQLREQYTFLAQVIGTARTISYSIGVSEAGRVIFEEEAGEYQKPRVVLSC